jgi:L-threonylcarbamoyladenylate synthase
LYGLGADAFSDAAVAKVYEIKKRDGKKPVHALVATAEMAEFYCEMNDVARGFLKAFPKGKVTTILKKRSEFDSGILRGEETFGFRIPDNAFCLALIRAFGAPITATSANVSGAPASRRVGDILAQLGDGARKIDLVVDAGELPESKPSTVVDLSGTGPKILREGAVSAGEITSFFA